MRYWETSGEFWIWWIQINRLAEPISSSMEPITWRHHDVKTLSALLTLCGGIHRSSMRNFDVSCVARLNKLLNKQSCCRWFDTLWRSCEATVNLLNGTDVLRCIMRCGHISNCCNSIVHCNYLNLNWIYIISHLWMRNKEHHQKQKVIMPTLLSPRFSSL